MKKSSCFAVMDGFVLGDVVFADCAGFVAERHRTVTEKLEKQEKHVVIVTAPRAINRVGLSLKEQTKTDQKS